MMSSLNKLLFSPRNAEPFAILRIGIGLAVFFEFICFAPYVLLFFSGEGFLPLTILSSLGPGPGPAYLLAVSDQPAWTTFCYIALLVTALAYAAGYHTRWTGPLLWLLQLSFINRNVYTMSAAPILNIQLLLIVLWVDTGRTWSWKKPSTQATIPSWVGHLITFQMAILYWKSGFYKAMGKAWVEGDALKFILASPNWRRWNYNWFLEQDWFLRLCEAATTITWTWELAFPLMLLNRWSRNLALAIGLILHGSQFFVVSTGSFPLLLLSIYPCLLYEKDFQRLKEIFRRKMCRDRAVK